MAEDLMKPWTVKSVAVRVIEEIATEARRDDLTVGRLVERLWDDYRGRGSPKPVNVPCADLPSLMQAAAAMAAAGIKPIPGEVTRLINARARQEQSLIGDAGLPGRKPGLPVLNGPAQPVERPAKRRIQV